MSSKRCWRGEIQDQPHHSVPYAGRGGGGQVLRSLQARGKGGKGSVGTRTAPAAAFTLRGRAGGESWAGEPALPQRAVEKPPGAGDTGWGTPTPPNSKCSAGSFLPESLAAGPRRGWESAPGTLFTMPLPRHGQLALVFMIWLHFFRHSALTSLQKAVHTLLTRLLSSPLIKIKLYLMHAAFFAAKTTCFPVLLSGAFVTEAIYLGR